MNFIRKLAVKSYRKELVNFTTILSKQEEAKLGKFVAFSIWIRSMLQVEGNIDPLSNNREFDEINLNPELEAYPLMLRDIKKFIKLLKRNKQNSKVIALELWAHTLQAIIRPELNDEIVTLWNLLMSSEKYWLEEIEFMEKEDLDLGIEKDIVDKTAHLAREIIKSLPPKQIGH